ncbi:MAG: GntR family transcriptional regulator [Actinomycetota bacterium]|nr:GntR family transcriptional regulator [Actinomycetota bacterium]
MSARLAAAGQAGARPADAARATAWEIYERLRQDIIHGVLAQGTPLQEVRLAQRYGVSRTPVREALRRLEHDNLVERGRQGLQVKTWSTEEVLQVYEARILLEGAAARHAASMSDQGDLATLHGLLTEDLAEPDAPPARHAELNVLFHETIWRAARNHVLLDLLLRLGWHVVRYPTTTLAHPGRWEQAVAEHQRILTAIDRADPDAAEQAAAEHMTNAREVRLRMWRERPPRST